MIKCTCGWRVGEGEELMWHWFGLTLDLRWLWEEELIFAGLSLDNEEEGKQSKKIEEVGWSFQKKKRGAGCNKGGAEFNCL